VDTTMQALRDVQQVLEFLLRGKQPGGEVQAALARLRASVTTEGEHAAETLAKLQARRAYLKPRRITLADRAKHLATLVVRLPANATATQKAKQAQAKIRADQATAEFNACVKEIAAVEAAIAQHQQPRRQGGMREGK
jgi:nucleoid-associated protein YgaU